MADSTPLTPEEAARLWASTPPPKAAAGSVAISPEEAHKAWQARPTPNAGATPGYFDVSGHSLGDTAKHVGQETVVQGAGLAPIIGGAYTGGEIGLTLGGPVGGLIGAPIGAAAGGFSSPTMRKYAGKLVGSEQPDPTLAEGEREANMAAQMEMVGPAASRIGFGVTNKAFDALVGKGDLVNTAKGAAQATEAENLAQQQKLAGAAEKEAGKQKAASASAAESTGQKNLASRERAFDQAQTERQNAETAQQTAQTKAAESAAAKQDEFQRNVVGARQSADANFEKARGNLEQGIVPEARQETIGGTLGTTPEQTRARQFADPAAYAQRQSELRQTIYDTKNQAEVEFGKRYEEKFSKFDKKELKLTATAQKAQQMEDWARANNVALDSSTRKLLAESKAMGTTPKPVGMEAEEIRSALGETASPSAGLSYTESATAKRVLSEELFRARGGDLVKKGGEIPTIAQGRGLKTKWGEEMSGAQGADGYVARSMRDAVLEDLDKSGVPGARELNNEYRQFRHGGLGDYKFTRGVSGAGDVTDVAGEIFNNPQRGMDFAKRLSPEQKTAFRDVYADYVHNGGKPIPEHAPILAELGFKGPLTKPESWVYADQTTAKLDEILSTSPGARAKLTAKIQEAEAASKADFEKTVIKQAYQDLKAMGTTGQRIKVAIDAAKTPSEKAAIALKAFNDPSLPQRAMGDVAAGQGQLPPQPGDVVRGMAGRQQTPGSAAYGAAIEAPRDARMAQQGFQPKDPTEAAVKSIQDYSAVSKGFWSRMKHRAEMYALLAVPMIAGGAVMGRSGTGATMAAGAGILGTIVGTGEGASYLWRRSIQQSPEAALEFYRTAVLNPGTEKGMNKLAQSAVDAAIAQHLSERGQPVEQPKPAPAAKGPGPMSQAIDRKTAEQIAGARGADAPEHIDHVEDLNKKIASGDTPDVQKDLKTGRLSTAEVRKMVDGNQVGVAAMFDGLSLGDSIDLLASGTPEEKEMALPVLAQKLQNEGRKLPPEQRVAIMQQLKRAMQPEAAQAGEVG